ADRAPLLGVAIHLFEILDDPRRLTGGEGAIRLQRLVGGRTDGRVGGRVVRPPPGGDGADPAAEIEIPPDGGRDGPRRHEVDLEEAAVVVGNDVLAAPDRNRPNRRPNGPPDIGWDRAPRLNP